MNIQFLVALLIMVIGLVGSVFPLLPGPAIIWLGALFYAWSTSFQPIGWVTLVLLALIALVAATSDVWVGAAGQRRAGASIWSTLGSTIGGIIGLFLLAIPGMLIGSIIGALLPDWQRWRDWRHISNVSFRTVKNWLVSVLVQVLLGIEMIAIFVQRVVLAQS
jgi:uncharacterized protein